MKLLSKYQLSDQCIFVVLSK
jgi:hypothetical protein